MSFFDIFKTFVPLERLRAETFNDFQLLIKEAFDRLGDKRTDAKTGVEGSFAVGAPTDADSATRQQDLDAGIFISTVNKDAAEASASAASVSENNAASSASASASEAAASAASQTASAASQASATSSKNSATASASGAASSASAAAADLVLTNADVVTTNADVVLTNADVDLTNADVLTTHADVVLTNADVVTTGNDVSTTTSLTNTATTKASEAASSATASSSSAAASAASYDSFDDRYLGPKSSAPTVDNDGNTLLTGALYWNTSEEAMQVYTGSLWKLVSTVVEGVYAVTEYTDRASQDTITTAYDLGLVQVLYNGVQLAASDFTATNGTSIVLTNPIALATDIVTVIRWGAVTTTTFLGEAGILDVGTSSGELPLADNVVLKDSLTGAGTLPAGTTAERPSTPAVGMVRYNATNAQFEGYGAEWSGLGGSSLGTNSVIRINAKVISENITFAGTENGSSVGPITIDTGYTVTVTTGSTWVIL